MPGRHAKQVIQLLPGGLDILGLFVVGGADVLKTQEAQLRTALNAIYRALDKLPQLHDREAEERLVAAVDPRTNKVTCRSLELSNLTASLRPAEWRFQEVRWHRVQSELFLDVTAGVAPLAAETTMFRQIMMSLEPLLASLSDSTCLVDGRMAASDAPLAADEGRPGKGAGRTFALDLLYDTAKTAPAEKLLEPADAVIRVSGRVHCLAYLHTKATVAEAVSALSRDTRRSLLARCQMHCDSLVEEQPSDESATVLHEPPRRVLAPLAPSQLHASDYLFPGDTAADSLQTFQDLFGLELQSEDVMDTVETPSEERAHSECSSAAGALDDLRELQSGGARCSWLHLLLAVAIAAVGILVSSLALIGPRSPGQH
ncbi:protein odr-4 homolog [Pollicipes pollicipes]|uniref:protein odr-4 homolog n=1 Tax=Pollicipes pollicipes TaxID=41117 RepID=UPI0018849EBC|nr:protein odr-4 homolog [Pollicipes pollicipes]